MAKKVAKKSNKEACQKKTLNADRHIFSLPLITRLLP